MSFFSIQKILTLWLFAGIVLGTVGFDAPLALAEKAIVPQLRTSEPSLDPEKEAKKLDKTQKVDSPIVVELFTTSDCSACVLADRILYDASKEKNVIPLSCHIKDMAAIINLGKKGEKIHREQKGPMDPCVFRQWAYSTRGAKWEVAVNVPTFFLNGDDDVAVTDMDFFTSRLNGYRYAAKNNTLEAMIRWKDNDTLTIMLPAAIRKSQSAQNASVWLVRYKDMEIEKINEGVNKGRVLRFSNIIQEVTHIGKWHGNVRTLERDVEVPKGGKEKGGYVVLVAEMLGEPIIAAGRVEDYPTAADLKKKSP